MVQIFSTALGVDLCCNLSSSAYHVSFIEFILLSPPFFGSLSAGSRAAT